MILCIYSQGQDSEESLCSKGEERSGSNLITVSEEKMSCHYVDKYMLVSGLKKCINIICDVFFPFRNETNTQRVF